MRNTRASAEAEPEPEPEPEPESSGSSDAALEQVLTSAEADPKYVHVGDVSQSAFNMYGGSEKQWQTFTVGAVGNDKRLSKIEWNMGTPKDDENYATTTTPITISLYRGWPTNNRGDIIQAGLSSDDLLATSVGLQTTTYGSYDWVKWELDDFEILVQENDQLTIYLVADEWAELKETTAWLQYHDNNKYADGRGQPGDLTGDDFDFKFRTYVSDARHDET